MEGLDIVGKRCGDNLWPMGRVAKPLPYVLLLLLSVRGEPWGHVVILVKRQLLERMS